MRGETGCREGCRPPTTADAAPGAGSSAPSSSGGGGSGDRGAAELPGTRYRLAKDEGQRAAQQQWGARVCGGAVRASGENPPGESAVRVGVGWVGL